MLINQTDHHVDGTKRLITPNINPHPLTVEARRHRLRTTHTTYVRTWQIKPTRLDQSTDEEAMPRHKITAMKPNVMTITIFGINTELSCHLTSAAILHDIEGLHGLYASPMR